MKHGLPAFAAGRRGVIESARFVRHVQSRVAPSVVSSVLTRLATFCKFVQGEEGGDNNTAASSEEEEADLLSALLNYDGLVRMLSHMRQRAMSFSTDRGFLEALTHGIEFFLLNDESLRMHADDLQRLRSVHRAYKFLYTRVNRAYVVEPRLSSDLDHLRHIGVWLEHPRDLLHILQRSDTEHERLWRLISRRGTATRQQYSLLREHLIVRLYVYGKVARPGAWQELCFSDITSPTTVLRQGIAYVTSRAGKTQHKYGLCALPLNVDLRRLLQRHQHELLPMLMETLGRPLHAVRADGSIIDRVFISTGARAPSASTFFSGVGASLSNFFVRHAGKRITTTLLAAFQVTHLPFASPPINTGSFIIPPLFSSPFFYMHPPANVGDTNLHGKRARIR